MRNKIVCTIVLAVMSLFTAVRVQAQNRLTISGVVFEDSGMPAIGAGVLIDGTTVGTITDIDGKYIIQDVPSDAVLVFSSLGFASVKVPVNGKTEINVTLSVDQQQLDEVMVVAYGTAKKESFTGSAAVVKGEALNKRAVANVTKSFEGTVAGVQVTSGGGQPGEGSSVVIRGVGSVNASSSPLYVVDGVPYDGSLSAINPADIETMTVLKDASAGALYGARGANGVIMITTRKGSDDKISISYKGTVGIAQRALPKYDLCDMGEFVGLTYEALRNKAQYSGEGMDFEAASNYAAENLGATLGGVKNPEYYNPYKNYTWETLIDRATGMVKADARAAWDENWMDGITNNAAFRTEHTVSVNGGNARSSYMYSGGYYKENGNLMNTDFDRITQRISGDTQAKDWLKIGMNANFAHVRSNFQDASGTATSNVWYTAQFMGPIYPLYLKNMNGEDVLDASGDRLYEYGSEKDNGYANRPSAQGFNSKAEIFENSTYYTRNTLSSRTYLTLGTVDKDASLYGLKFTTNLGVDFVDYSRTVSNNKYHGNAASQGGSIYKYATRTLSYTFNQLLTYNKKIADHSIDVLAGHEYYRYTYNYAIQGKSGIVDGIHELAPAVTTLSNSTYSNNYAIESVLARLNYGYRDTYYFDASWRTDGSSRFHKDNRWGNFWSVGMSWRISNEDFMSSTSSWLNNLTARASYGVQGNDNLGTYYAWQGLFSYEWVNGTNSGAIASTLENKDVTWEKNGNLNVGLEASMLRGRLNATVEFYSRRTRDMLLNNPLPLSSGFTGYDNNIGSMVNRGLEMSVMGVIADSKNFHWDATLMGSLNRNKVLALTGNQNQIITGTYVIETGKPIYTFYTSKSAGVSPATGRQLYYAYYKTSYDESGNQIFVTCPEYVTDNVSLASKSKYYFGSREPVLFGSFQSNFVLFSQFDLSFLMTYSLGGKIIDGLYNGAMNVTYAGNNWHRHALRRWRQPGDITDVPMVEIAAARATTDADLVSASYLALKNITVGYTLPSKMLEKAGIDAVRFFFTADNVKTFCALDGMDPQCNFSGSVSYTYTPSRVFMLGVDLKF